MTLKKKKEATTRELFFGSGLLVLFSPLILCSLIGLINAIVNWLIDPYDIEFSRWVFIPIAIALLAVMLFILAKFSIRFRLLIGRIIGVFRERRRYRNTVDMSSAETSLTDDDVLHRYAADPQATDEHTEYR